MLYPARSILAIDTSSFGKSLALLPVMRALRDAYPNTQLVVAAPGGTCELLTACDLIDETISLGVIKHSDHSSSGGLKRLYELATRARKYDFDAILDFSPNLETLVVSRLFVRGRVFTASKLPKLISVLLDPGGSSRSRVLTVSSDYENILKQLGVKMNDTRLAITASIEEDTKFEQRLASSGSRGGELIVLLYASNPLNRGSWPVAAFAEVGTRLSNNFSARIVAVDEPSDNAFTDAVGSLLPPGAIRLARPRAPELVAAAARASLVITDEPAIALIASEQSTPVIEIADSGAAATASSTGHRIAQGSSRVRVLPDTVYEIASEMIQENRSPSLFRRT